MQEKVKLVGCYDFDVRTKTVMFEIIINDSIESLKDLKGFYHYKPYQIKLRKMPKTYLEQYLSRDGTKRIHSLYVNPDQRTKPARLIFFIDDFSIDNPLVTPFGKITVQQLEQVPLRLINIIEYENIN